MRTRELGDGPAASAAKDHCREARRCGYFRKVSGHVRVDFALSADVRIGSLSDIPDRSQSFRFAAENEHSTSKVRDFGLRKELLVRLSPIPETGT